MTSTRIKNLARAIQRQRPGMKYTEALRLAQGKGIRFDPMSADPSVTDILRAAGHDVTPIQLTPGQTGTLDPFALAERSDTADPRPLERSTPPGVVHLEPMSVDSVIEEAVRAKAERMVADAEETEAPQLIEIEEWHSLAPSAESKARFNELLRKGRSVPPKRDAEGRPIVYADPMGDFVPLRRTPAPTIDWTPKEPFSMAAMQEAVTRAREEGNVTRVEMDPASQDQFKGVFDTVRNFMQEHPDLSTEQVARHMHDELFGKAPDGTVIGRINGSTEPVWFKAPEAKFPTVEAGNILVWGDTGTGRTTALRALVSHALGKGWRASIADVRGDGYADFLDSPIGAGRVVASRGHRSLDQGWDLRFGTEGEKKAMDFIASLEPGTAQDPHLVVIDEGQTLLISRHQSYEGGQWMNNLHRLLADPHTVVAFQAGAGGGVPSDDFISLFDSRLIYGRHEAETWKRGFRDIVPESAFQAFDFNASPQPSDLIHNHNRGIFWNGMQLGHVAPEDTLPPTKA